MFFVPALNSVDCAMIPICVHGVVRDAEVPIAKLSNFEREHPDNLDKAGFREVAFRPSPIIIALNRPKASCLRRMGKMLSKKFYKDP